MKLAFTGKGGVGKTTLCALVALELKSRNREVVAIDVDPDSNLASCLGYKGEIKPLVELKDLIEERTGVKPGRMGGMFKLNPFVADLPERYGVEIEGIKVLVAGSMKSGGSGCYCPENALVRALVGHAILDAKTDLVLDMEAGIEHLTRGTAGKVDCLVIVVEPSELSIDTAKRIKKIAEDLGIKKIKVIGNKLQSEEDLNFINSRLTDIHIAGNLNYDDMIRKVGLGLVRITEIWRRSREIFFKIVENLKK